MKNFTNFRFPAINVLLLIILSAGMNFTSFGKQTIFTESFENGGAVTAGWAVENVSGSSSINFVSTSIYPSGYTSYNGTYCAEFNSFYAPSGILRLKQTTPISTIGYTNISLSFAWLESSGFPAIYDHVTVQWSNDGATWSSLADFPRYNSIQGWKIKTVALPSVAQEQSTVYIAFLFTSGFGNNCYLDYARIAATGAPALTTVSIGTGSQSCNYPFTTFWMDGKTQMLYHAEEILGAGGNPGMISKIAFDVTSANPITMNSYNMKMMNTTMSSIGGYVTAGMTSCYSGTYSVAGTGWQEITLTTPFPYSGNNILLEICYDNNMWSGYSYVKGSTFANNVAFFSTDLPTGSGCDFIDHSNPAERPNIRLTEQSMLCPPSDLAGTAIDNSAYLTWVKPCSDACYIFDDGTMENGWAYNPGYNLWLGNYFPVSYSYSGVLRSFDMLWWNNPASLPQNLQIDVFSYSGTYLGSSQVFQVPVPAPDNYWTLVLDNNIAFTGPFFVMLHWNSVAGSTHWLGYDSNGPMASANNAYEYNGSSFTQWTTYAAAQPGNFCLRACEFDQGTQSLRTIIPGEPPVEAGQPDHAATMAQGELSSSLDIQGVPPVSPEGSDSPLTQSGLLGYNIYENNGTTPVQYVAGQFTLNTSISNLTPGIHTFGIKALYDLTFYGFPGQTGLSALEGPVTVDISSVPAIRTVQNRYIGSGQQYCFDATQTLNIAGNNTYFVLNNGGSATMVSGQKIFYRPDVLVTTGAYMHGYIAPSGPYCESFPASMVSTSEGEELQLPGKQETHCSLFPNPTTGEFTLQVGSTMDPTNLKVEIYTVQGTKARSVVINGETKHTFSLATMPVGLYVVRVISGEKSEMMKVIRQ
jgi:hypothetical protein